MTARYPYPPDGYAAMRGLEHYLSQCSLEPRLVHLVKLRASQLNGCAFCIDMHWSDLRALGEPEVRLYLLDAWREATHHTERQRAALEWTEAVTRLSAGQVSDALFERLMDHFSKTEIADLTLVIATINAWNRLSVASAPPPRTTVDRVTPAGQPT